MSSHDGITRITIDATRGTARVEALDANDQPPVFIASSLFAAVEEDAEFGTSVTKLEVSENETSSNLHYQISSTYKVD